MNMQSLKMCVQWLNVAGRSIDKRSMLQNIAKISATTSLRCDIHTSAKVDKNIDPTPSNWLKHNKTIFPVQTPEEERRPAYVCHMKTNIRYSPKRMWYVAILIRGLSVDEALKQLSFVLKKGAAAVKETVLEAQQLAVEKHNVEFKSNLWVAESFCSKGRVIKGIRRHARGRPGEIRYTYSHYFVRLEEGPPPAHYYLPAPKGKEELLNDWIKQMRKRKITSSL